MGVGVSVSCDGEGCRGRVNEQLRRGNQRTAALETAWIEWAEGPGQEVWALASGGDGRGVSEDSEGPFQVTIESGWLSLGEGWTIEKVEPSKGYPDGLIFRCGDCSK